MQEVEGSPTEKEATQPTEDQTAEGSAGLAIGQEAANPDSSSGLGSGCVVVESQDAESEEVRSNQQRECSEVEESFTVPEELQQT